MQTTYTWELSAASWRPRQHEIGGQYMTWSYEVRAAEMIDQARRYPITSIIAFPKGRHRCCPFHEDRKPSMALYDNHVHCFVCNRSWDSISAMMAREGVSFREAVRALQ